VAYASANWCGALPWIKSTAFCACEVAETSRCESDLSRAIHVLRYAAVSPEAIGVCVHAMRATAATNALSNEADIAKVQEWLGHANVSTTRLYDRRKSKPEDSPTFHGKY